MAEVFLILGSNKGDKKYYLENSINMINKKIGKIIKISSYYKTEAWKMNNAPFFLNTIIILKTLFSPIQILDNILYIESFFGRKKKIKKFYQNREIDIDILFYDQIIFESYRLSIPHPLLQLRRFVLEPLCELVPEKEHPKFTLKVSTLLLQCMDFSKVERIFYYK